MASLWSQVVAEHRDMLLGKEISIPVKIWIQILISELDSMTVCETAVVKKTKEKKNSFWNIFNGYGSQAASAESL